MLTNIIMGRIFSTSCLLVVLKFVQLRAWSPVFIRKSDSPMTALFAEKVPSSKRRFAQSRTHRYKYGSDSKIGSVHKERLKTAGRKGTKRFVDPCKVFIGNLSFDTDDKRLASFILDTMGQTRMVLHSYKVIKDWKTGKSKGYGFIEFTDPIFATVCLDVCNGKKLDGRAIKVSQGKKKDEENKILYTNRKGKNIESKEEKVISMALDEAEDNLKELEVDEDGIVVFNDGGDENLVRDALLFGLDLDEDDEQDDGIFLERTSKYEEDFDENMNREQRRDAARRLKKKKLPSKGFG